MRSLNTRIKADFIKKETSGSSSASSADGLAPQFSDDPPLDRPILTERSNTEDESRTSERVEEVGTPKKSRPRSFTFNRSKDSVPTKKERPVSHIRVKSSDVTSSENPKSVASSSAAQTFSFMSRVPKPALPEDYISYLHKVQKPQLMEVARIQKLRQLLRNEAVTWVDEFIRKNGMAAIVNLLYRIIEVEWRYDRVESAEKDQH